MLTQKETSAEKDENKDAKKRKEENLGEIIDLGWAVKKQKSQLSMQSDYDSMLEN